MALTSNPTGFDYWNILIGQGDYYNPYFIDNGKKVQIEGMHQYHYGLGAGMAGEQTGERKTVLSVVAS